MKRTACTILLVLSVTGAARAAEKPEEPRPDIVLADFEGADYGKWTAAGDAFGSGPARRTFHSQKLRGYVGKGFVNTFNEQKDTPTGTLTSPTFEIGRKYLCFLLAGGKHPGKTCVDLRIDEETVRTATGRNDDRLQWVSWDVTSYAGRTATLRIVDRVSGSWGHVDADQIVLTDTPRGGAPMKGESESPKGKGGFHTKFTYRNILGPEKGITRRDPSDVIRVKGVYYVWYSKTPNGPSGYDATIWYATSPDGVTWTEKGEALPRGGAGAWDEASVFTPGILVADGRYYLPYTAIPKNNNLAGTPTAIGMAESDSPDGPWKRIGTDPVLTISKDPSQFDSFRVDDACMLIREGKIWMYYKGRQKGRSPRETKMGIAIAEKPAGPYIKCKENPVIRAGHEVLVWPHGTGVAALISQGPPAVWYSDDGIRFTMKAPVSNRPTAPGAWRPEAFTGAKVGSGITWGVSHKGGTKSSPPWLVRYDCNLTPPPPAISQAHRRQSQSLIPKQNIPVHPSKNSRNR